MSNPVFQFQKVKRQQCKASIVIEGLSGRGKSGLALILARALASDWDKVFAIDTENGSLKLYDGLPGSNGEAFRDFNVAEFTPDIGYKPSNYQAFREAAIEAGAEVLIQDSFTHAWSYSGGILDMVAELKKNNARYQKDAYAAWGDDTIIKEKQLLSELFRDHRCHIISTLRVKEKMDYQYNEEKKKNEIVSIGEQQIMQADMKYEPDLVLRMISPGGVTGKKITYPHVKVIKSRYAIFQTDEEYDITPSICKQLKDYLEEGSSPEELLEQQRQEYIEGITAFLDSNVSARAIWKELKKQAGYDASALKDIPLDALKPLFIQLTI